MARPKKLSGNDKFMLSKLRGEGLFLKPDDPGIPIKTHWAEWHGIKLSGESCNIDKNYRLPKTKLGFGNTQRESERITTRLNNQNKKIALYLAVCERLLEYKAQHILTNMLLGHEKRSTCLRILKKYSHLVEHTKINHKKYDHILSNEWDLPKMSF